MVDAHADRKALSPGLFAPGDDDDLPRRDVAGYLAVNELVVAPHQFLGVGRRSGVHEDVLLDVEVHLVRSDVPSHRALHALLQPHVALVRALQDLRAERATHRAHVQVALQREQARDEVARVRAVRERHVRRGEDLAGLPEQYPRGGDPLEHGKHEPQRKSQRGDGQGEENGEDAQRRVNEDGLRLCYEPLVDVHFDVDLLSDVIEP